MIVAGFEIHASPQRDMDRRSIAEYEERMRHGSPYEQGMATRMMLTLETAVPFVIAEIAARGGVDDRDLAHCEAVAHVLGAHGDILQFRDAGGGENRDGSRCPTTGEVMAGLIRAMAILAFLPGGVTFGRCHFEAVRRRTAQTIEKEAARP